MYICRSCSSGPRLTVRLGVAAQHMLEEGLRSSRERSRG